MITTLLTILFLGAFLWKWREERSEQTRKTELQGRIQQEKVMKEHEWCVGKLILSLETGVESEVLIRPNLRQVVDTYLTRYPLIHLGTAYYDKHLRDLLYALQTLGLIDGIHSKDAYRVKAYYDLKRWTDTYNDLIDSGKQRGWLNIDGTFTPAMQWRYIRPGLVQPGYLNIDGTFTSVRPELVPHADLDNLNQTMWQEQVLSLRNRHPARSSGYYTMAVESRESFNSSKGELKSYVDRVLEQPEPTNKAESEANAYVEVALRSGAYSRQQSSNWIQRVTEDRTEQNAAGSYGLCLYALRKGWISKESPSIDKT
jgi:hypothetical protein